MSDGTLSSRITRRLRAYKLVPAARPVLPRRTNASGSQRITGAWSWVCPVDEPNGTHFATLDIGSQVSMRACLAAPYWDMSETCPGQITVDPCTDPDHLHSDPIHWGPAMW